MLVYSTHLYKQNAVSTSRFEGFKKKYLGGFLLPLGAKYVSVVTYFITSLLYSLIRTKGGISHGYLRENVLHNKWQLLTQARIRRLVVSVLRRISAVVAAQGGHIPYQ